MIDAFHFIRPACLLLIPFVVLLWWLVRRAQDPLRGWRSAIEDELLAALTSGDEERNRWRNALLLIAWLLAIVALAGPTWRLEPSPFADDPVPLMVLLLADESMEQDDLLPSRMERAQLKVADLAAARKGEPLGLIAYAGTAHLVLPPTRDTFVVATMAAEISPAIMPKPGNGLVDALKLAERILKKTGGSILVVADSLPTGDDAALAEFQRSSRLLIQLLSVTSMDSADAATLDTTADAFKASVTQLTADNADVQKLVRRAAHSSHAVALADKGTHWAESGWWLVPVLAAVSLLGFRRTVGVQPNGDVT